MIMLQYVIICTDLAVTVLYRYNARMIKNYNHENEEAISESAVCPACPKVSAVIFIIYIHV